MITLAVLDIAGTTVDEGGAVYRVLADVVADHGRPATDADLRRWMGADKRAALAALTGEDDVEALHARFVSRLTATYAKHPPQAMPGARAALKLLRSAGVRVVLTTGFDRTITDPLLASVGWRTGVDLDGVVCAPEVAAGRPAPDMIHRAMHLTGVTDPANVLTAGDTVLDVRAGLAAGARVVAAVLTGAQTEKELRNAGATHIIDGVADLPAIKANETKAKIPTIRNMPRLAGTTTQHTDDRPRRDKAPIAPANEAEPPPRRSSTPSPQSHQHHYTPPKHNP